MSRIGLCETRGFGSFISGVRERITMSGLCRCILFDWGSTNNICDAMQNKQA